jgi:hypothetical protein
VAKTAEERIEAEIDEVFSQVELEQKEPSKFLRELDLQPLCRKIMRNYADGRGRSPKYKPVAMGYTLIFQHILGLTARNQVRQRLKRNHNEAKDLGYTLEHNIPNNQNLNYFVNQKISQETLELIEHAADYILQKNEEKDKLKDVERHYDFQQNTDSEDSVSRPEGFQKTLNFLKWKLFPRIQFPRSDNNTYDDIELLELLVFAGMENICSNEAYDILAEKADKDLPTSQNVLKHIREMDRQEIQEMYEEAGQRILELAEEEGRMDTEVDVAIDITVIPYYGDKNDEMVAETQPKDGTTHCYKFATLKVVTGNEQYAIKSKPVNKFANTEDLVEDLIQYAEQHIDIRRVYMDRGFFSGKVVNTMDENDWKFIMPATRTSGIKNRLEEADGETIQEYELNGSEKANFNLALREGKDGELKAFATNCGRLEILTHNLFDLYGRRWDIETGYRVQKNKFLPKTTSKNYNVRLFLFLFSELLYNCWMLINVRISLELYGEIQEEKEITAKKFIHCLFEAFDGYG